MVSFWIISVKKICLLLEVYLRQFIFYKAIALQVMTLYEDICRFDNYLQLYEIAFGARNSQELF